MVHGGMRLDERIYLFFLAPGLFWFIYIHAVWHILVQDAASKDRKGM